MNNNKERKTTNSDSFGRELETAELSVFDEDFEKYFYDIQLEIIDLWKVNKQDALDLRKELLKEVKKELKSDKDEDFNRFSIFTEMLDIYEHRTHLKEIKKGLIANGIKNFLIEYHQGTEGNTNHIQYTGNKSYYANEFITQYVTKNNLSMHYIKEIKKTTTKENNKEKMDEINKLLNEQFKKLDELLGKKSTNEKQDITLNKKQSLQDVINEAKKYEEKITKERNVFVNTYENARRNRRFKRSNDIK